MAFDFTVVLIPLCGLFLGLLAGYAFGGSLIMDRIPGKDIWLKRGAEPIFNIQSDGTGSVTDGKVPVKQSIVEKFFGKKKVK